MWNLTIKQNGAINLCEYTPKPLLERVLSVLERNKEMCVQSMKRLSEINLSKF